MSKIEFVKSYPALQVESGANLMQSLLKGGLPVASSCGGKGICGKCRIQVVTGTQNFSPINESEQLLRERLKIPSGMRISCQTEVTGDVVVDTSYW